MADLAAPKRTANEVSTLLIDKQIDLMNWSGADSATEFKKKLGDRTTYSRVGQLLKGSFVPKAKGLETKQLKDAISQKDIIAQEVYFFEGRRLLTMGAFTVRFNRAVSDDELKGLATQFDVSVYSKPTYADNVVRFKIEEGRVDVIASAEALANLDSVLWAEPDFAIEVSKTGNVVPNRTFFSNQWYLENLKLPQAWGKHTTGSEIIVAIFDDGVDAKHPELIGKMIEGHDFIEGDSDMDASLNPSGGHGRACAGIVSAIMNNGKGIAGVTPSSKIMPIRIVSESDFASDADLAEAIKFASDRGAKILNMSIGYSPPVLNKNQSAIDRVSSKSLVVASAGNHNLTSDVLFPASSTCVAVGSVRSDDTLWYYSCFGPGKEVDIVAPSGDLFPIEGMWTLDARGRRRMNSGGGTDQPSGDYTGRFGGTSGACPIVAGVAAWIWSAFPSLSPSQVR